MATPLIIDSFAHGIFSTAGGGLYSTINGTPTRDTSTLRGSDPASMLVNPSAATEYVDYAIPAGSNLVYLGCALRVHTRQAASDVGIFRMDGGAGTYFVMYMKPDGTPYVQCGNSGSFPNGSNLAVDTWYWMEFILDASVSGNDLYWRIDGKSQTSDLADSGGSIGNITAARIGSHVQAVTTVFNFSCAIIASAGSTSDWMGEHVSRAYSPDAVGTHNLDASTSAFYFKNVGAAETALTTAETTSYQAIDDVPLDADSDRVLVKAGGTTTSYIDPTGNTAQVSWTNDYTAIDEGTRQPSAPGADEISYATVGSAVQEGQTYPNTLTHVAGSTYTLWVNCSTSGTSKRKIQYAISVNNGSNYGALADLLAPNLAQQWVSKDISASIASQADLDGLATGFALVSTGGGNSGTGHIYEVYVQQDKPNLPTAAYYLEYAIANSDESIPPAAVRVINSIRNDSGTTANAISAKIRDGASDGAVYTDLNINSATNIYKTATFATKPSGSAWTDAAFDALTFRWGFTSDPDSTPRLEGVMIEAVFPPAPRTLPLPQPSNFQDPAIF